MRRLGRSPAASTPDARTAPLTPGRIAVRLTPVLLAAAALSGCADTGMARLSAEDFAAVEGMPVRVHTGDPEDVATFARASDPQ